MLFFWGISDPPPQLHLEKTFLKDISMEIFWNPPMEIFWTAEAGAVRSGRHVHRRKLQNLAVLQHGPAGRWPSLPRKQAELEN